MLELICWGKTRWFLSWLIVTIIIGMILQFIGFNEYVIGGVQIAYSIIHTIIVNYIFNTECEELEDKDEFERNNRKKVRFDHMSK